VSKQIKCLSLTATIIRVYSQTIILHRVLATITISNTTDAQWCIVTGEVESSVTSWVDLHSIVIPGQLSQVSVSVCLSHTHSQSDIRASSSHQWYRNCWLEDICSDQSTTSIVTMMIVLTVYYYPDDSSPNSGSSLFDNTVTVYILSDWWLNHYSSIRWDCTSIW